MGGGDWYVSPTALPNLIQFCNQQLNTRLASEEVVVTLSSPEIFLFPWIHMTGHGNVFFSDGEARNLKKYLEAGGFLHINDSYGMEEFVKREMKKVFPDRSFEEVPVNHPIYQKPYRFPTGLPKIHEHDNKPPRGYGIFVKGRLVCFLGVESDIGDGWESPEIHKDSPERRQKALEMGANLIHYAFSY